MSVKKFLIALTFMLLLVLYFFRPAYLPSELEVHATLDPQSSASLVFQWDAGFGYRQHSLITRELENKKKTKEQLIAKIAVPQLALTDTRLSCSRCTIEKVALSVHSNTHSLELPSSKEGSLGSLKMRSKRWGERPIILIHIFLALFTPYFFFTLFKRWQQIPHSYKKDAAFLFLSSTATFLFWPLINYPALVHGDAFWSWDQTKTFALNDWHPVMYQLFLIALQQFSDSPFSIAVFQIIATNLIVTSFGVFALCQGVQRKYVYLAFALHLLWPVSGYMSHVLYKDIPFSISLVGATTWLLTQFKPNSWRNSDIDLREMISRPELPLFFIGIANFRHNGPAAAILFCTVIFLVFNWKSAIKFIAACTLLFALARGLMFPMLGVSRNDPSSLILESKIPTIVYAHNAKGYWSPDPTKDRSDYLTMIEEQNGYPVFEPTKGHRMFFYATPFARQNSYESNRLVNSLFYNVLINNFPLFAAYKTTVALNALGLGHDFLFPLHQSDVEPEYASVNFRLTGTYFDLDSKFPRLRSRLMPFLAEITNAPKMNWVRFTFFSAALPLIVFGIYFFTSSCLSGKLTIGVVLANSAITAVVITNSAMRFHYAIWLFTPIVLLQMAIERQKQVKTISL